MDNQSNNQQHDSVSFLFEEYRHLARIIRLYAKSLMFQRIL